MAEQEFEGEKFTLTKVELGLLAALALVVGTFLGLGVSALVVLAVILSAVMLVIMTMLAAGKTPRLFDDR